MAAAPGAERGREQPCRRESLAGRVRNERGLCRCSCAVAGRLKCPDPGSSEVRPSVNAPTCRQITEPQHALESDPAPTRRPSDAELACKCTVAQSGTATLTSVPCWVSAMACGCDNGLGWLTHSEQHCSVSVCGPHPCWASAEERGESALVPGMEAT